MVASTWATLIMTSWISSRNRILITFKLRWKTISKRKSYALGNQTAPNCSDLSLLYWLELLICISSLRTFNISSFLTTSWWSSDERILNKSSKIYWANLYLLFVVYNSGNLILLFVWKSVESTLMLTWIICFCSLWFDFFLDELVQLEQCSVLIVIWKC